MALPVWMFLLAALAPHPITLADQFRVGRIGTVVLSPDGRTLVYEIATLDREANGRRVELWAAPATAGGPAPGPLRATSRRATATRRPGACTRPRTTPSRPTDAHSCTRPSRRARRPGRPIRICGRCRSPPAGRRAG